MAESFKIVHLNDSLSKSFVDDAIPLVNKELSCKGLPTVEASSFSEANGNILFAVTSPNSYGKNESKFGVDTESSKEGKIRTVSDVVVLLSNNEWNESLEKMIKEPTVNVLRIFRAKDGKISLEDKLAFAETVKTEIRKRMRCSDEASSFDVQHALSKEIDWKCKVAESGRTSFFSFFMDPSMEEMCSKLKRYMVEIKKSPANNTISDYKEQLKEQLDGKSKPDYNAIKDKKLQKIKPPSVLLLGETGVGKTLAAEWIAEALGKKDNFASLNIGAIAENMIYGELFGATKYSYSGAYEDMYGIFLKNIGGVVFLDEIGEMDGQSQVCLLKYLDASEVRPIGWADDALHFPTVIIAATNRPLDKLVSEGKDNFRSDLFYRFDYVLHIPSLKERKKDMRFLISMTLQDDKVNPVERDGKRAGKRAVERITLDAIEYLEKKDYPGNFRDLIGTIRLAVQKAHIEGCNLLDIRHVV